MVKNFVDLKCVIMRWQARHRDEAIADGTRILKRSDWQGRKRRIFNAILAIRRAEAWNKAAARPR
jgi:hypothetical protein